MYAQARDDVRPERAAAQLSTRLVTELEEAILAGEFKGGERLEENSLAARYGVSRTPIRESLRELAARGLVEIRPRRGAVVRATTPADLAEMFEAMAELEASCGRLAARRASAADLARIEEAQLACERAGEAGDAGAYAAANQRFHLALQAASHNRALVEAARRLSSRLEPYRRLLFRLAERRAASRREHEAILAALAAGDAAAVEAGIRAHIVMLGERFTTLVASLTAPDALGL